MGGLECLSKQTLQTTKSGQGLLTLDPVQPNKAEGNCDGGHTIRSTRRTRGFEVSKHATSALMPSFPSLVSTDELVFSSMDEVTALNMQKQWSRRSIGPPGLLAVQ